MQGETRESQAKTLFAGGFNCAQAVVAAFSEKYGVDQAIALKMAGALGGGLRCGEVCGAASGAALVIGLACGHTHGDDETAKAKCRQHTIDFMARFKQQNGHLRCEDLLGVNTATEAGAAQAREQNLFATVCPGLVGGAARLLEEMGY